MTTEHTPQPGDVVRLDGPYWGAKPGDTAVIDSSPYPEGRLMVVFRASAFRNAPDHPSRIDRDRHYVSCSGGPCPGVYPGELEYVGTTTRRFWNWGDNLPGAGMGVDYQQTVNLWSWKGQP